MAKRQRWGKVTAITAAVVAITAGAGGVLISGAMAGAAPRSFAQRPVAATPAQAAARHTKSPIGGYEIFENGQDAGRLLLNTDQSVSFLGSGDDGLWVETGSSIAISITYAFNDNADVGCTFSGVIGKKGLNSAKKQGNYVCPGDEGVNFQWYAPRTFK